MDTISRDSVVKAAQALGLNPWQVDHVVIDASQMTMVTSRTRHLDATNAVIACQHLGYDPRDVSHIEISGTEVRVTLFERDEHGEKLLKHSKDPHGNDCPETVMRVEVCNVG